MTGSAGPRIIVVVKDLFFALRIGNTLRPLGYQVQRVDAEGALQAATRVDPPALIVVDLNFRGIDPPRQIAALKAAPATRAVPILAFGSHLDHAAREAAKAAGADRVVANSKLVEDLPALVARYAGAAHAPAAPGAPGADPAE